jgi:aldehyde dehydrogenase (NAD+)
VVWVNSTNLFDAAAGFGGYRESGFGREGGREGLSEYLKPVRPHNTVRPPVEVDAEPTALPPHNEDTDTTWPSAAMPPIDRTPKLFIGGKQHRSDSGYSRRVVAPSGRVVGEVGEGNRKDVRNAVEAAHAMSWHRWVGDQGAIVSIDTFGASAPAPVLFKEFGITAEKVAEAARALVG